VQYNRSYFYAQSVAEFAEALGYKNQSVIPAENTVKTLNTKTPTNSNEKPKHKKSSSKKKTKAN
jgi:membrane-bound lytic murein transglycosylase B